MHKTLPDIPILMYHEVWDDASFQGRIRHTNPSYVVSETNFNDQMRYLRDNSFRTLTIDEYLENGNSETQKNVILTFDDGWFNNYSIALPILKKYNLKATIFVVSDFIGQTPYMDWVHLKKMQAAGISIQSHTATHGALTVKSELEIKNELESSKKVIEDRLGVPVNFLSAPHGMVNRKVLDALANIGYRAICTSEPGFSHISGPPAVLKRVNISNAISQKWFQKTCDRHLIHLLTPIASKNLKNFIKNIIGYNIYRKIYQLWYRIKE